MIIKDFCLLFFLHHIYVIPDIQFDILYGFFFSLIFWGRQNLTFFEKERECVCTRVHVQTREGRRRRETKSPKQTLCPV